MANLSDVRRRFAAIQAHQRQVAEARRQGDERKAGGKPAPVASEAPEATPNHGLAEAEARRIELEAILPPMADHWGYDDDDLALARASFFQPEHIEAAIATFRLEAEAYGIELPSREAILAAAAGGQLPAYGSTMLKSRIAALGDRHDPHDAEWMRSLVSLLPRNEQIATITNYGECFAAEGRPAANLWLLDLAESRFPEKTQALQRKKQRMTP